MDEGSLAEEIEVLEAIYIEELDVQTNDRNEVNTITLQLHPATGEDRDQRFVCMTLILDLSPQYPDVPPDITIKNPRGIAEEEILSLREDMHQLCEDRKGGPVLFELIELAKDSLTAGNIPHCPCMICLEHFHEGEKFTKTECYHYFHESCLSRYVTHMLTKTPEIVPTHTEPCPAANKLVCPVCREEIHYQFDDFNTSPVEDNFVFTPTKEMRDLQARMAAMLEQQRANGGIIDVEAERNKYLVKNDDVVLLCLPNAKSKEKPNKPKSTQSRDEKVNQDSKGSEARESDRAGRSHGSNRNNKFGELDGSGRSQGSNRNNKFGELDGSGKRQGSNRNDKFGKGRGRGYRYSDNDSPRDNENRWKDRRDRRRTENTSDSRSRKRENESNCDHKDDSIKDFRNKVSEERSGNRNRNQKNYRFNERRNPDEVKEKFEKEAKGEKNHFEKSGKLNEREVEKVKEKKHGFGRPPESETSETTSESSNKGDSSIGAVSDKLKEERNGQDRKGFGRPKRKVENKSDNTENVKNTLDSPHDNQNENGAESLESKTASGENKQQDVGDLEKVHDKDRTGNQTTNDRKFKGNRGGFGRPPRKEDGNEENLNEDANKSAKNNQTHRSGGFGRPDREYYTREKPRQNRGGFGKPGSHFKESSEEMSRPGSGKTYSRQDRNSSQKNYEEYSKDGGRPLSSGRDRYNKDERHSGNWRNHERNSKYRSDENWRYSNDEKSHNYPKARRNQGKERSFHKGRESEGEYRSSDGTESVVNKPGSRNKNISPRYNERVNKDLENIDRKFDDMIVSDTLCKSLESKNADISESSDKLEINSDRKDCDKNEFNDVSSRPLSSQSDEHSDTKGVKKAPPGFVTSPPPGFVRTEGDSMSIVQPPPGFRN